MKPTNLIDYEITPTDVEEQPRSIKWNDILSAFSWPCIVICLFSIPNLFITKDTINVNALIPQPWRPTSHTILFTLVALFNLLVLTFTCPSLDIPPIALKLVFSVAWQQLVAVYLCSSGVSCEVGIILIVIGGHLLALLVNVAAGDYAWPQASREEQREALETAQKKRCSHRRNVRESAPKCNSCRCQEEKDRFVESDVEKGVDIDMEGEWDITDELVTKVFKRPSRGFRAAVYFLNSASFAPSILMMIIMFYWRLVADYPWSGHGLLAYLLFFVTLLWLEVMNLVANELGEHPEGYVSDIKLGGNSTRDARSPKW